MESSIAQELNIKQGKFMFTIKYFDGTIRIEALHEEEHLLWANSFDSSIESSNKEGQQLIVKTSPSMIYKLLSNYANGKNDQYVAIKFPEKYKSPDDAICVEINIKLPYDDNCDDSKILILYSVKVSLEERFNKKIAFTHAKLTTHIDNIDKKFNESLDNASKKHFNELSVIIAGIDKRNTDQINALKIELLNKITGDMFALKTELLNKITSDVTTLKTDVTNKLIAETTRVNTELAKYQLKA